MKEQVDTLVKAWYVVTMNETRDIIKNGAIALKNGLIVEVGKFSDLEKKYDAKETLGGDRFVLTPGMY